MPKKLVHCDGKKKGVTPQQNNTFNFFLGLK
jgi:hypothetical protein